MTNKITKLDNDVKQFIRKLFDSVNKIVAGHLKTPDQIDKSKEESFKNWIDKKTSK